MGKGEKTGLGRALVKHHKQMIQQSKEKGKYYRSQNKVLESVTEINDIDAVIEQADEAHRLFASVNTPAKLAINLDLASSANSEMTAEERRDQQKKEEALHASSLRIPRRPPWNAKMSIEELDANEKQAFLEWRRILASLEENENLVLTPFEKNLDIWRQLWRVLERSDLLVMVIDARDPLFYRCPDLEACAREIDEHKRTLLLVNKADLLPLSVREQWAKYFTQNGILFLFWSAKAASAALEEKKLSLSSGMQNIQQELASVDTKVYSRDELLARLQSEAEDIVSMQNRTRSNTAGPSHIHSNNENPTGGVSPRGVVVGFVGYPNVGKSSTINALVGEKRTGVTSTPGKTKHFQTLMISEKLTLCDCPGLVFPSFTSSRYHMIASGVLPIDRMTEHREAIQVVANQVPRSVIEDVYKISLPKPKAHEPQSRPPLAAEFLRSYCASRRYVASSGLPDETRAARQILKDYIQGKLPHFKKPPGRSDHTEDFGGAATTPISSEIIEESDSFYDEDDPPMTENGSSPCEPSLNHVLDDLNSFDMANGLYPSKETAIKSSRAPHKQHKKPQRKKDRTWRVRDDGGDGMPLARVFQKQVNSGPLNA